MKKFLLYLIAILSPFIFISKGNCAVNSGLGPEIEMPSYVKMYGWSSNSSYSERTLAYDKEYETDIEYYYYGSGSYSNDTNGFSFVFQPSTALLKGYAYSITTYICGLNNVSWYSTRSMGVGTSATDSLTRSTNNTTVSTVTLGEYYTNGYDFKKCHKFSTKVIANDGLFISQRIKAASTVNVGIIAFMGYSIEPLGLDNTDTLTNEINSSTNTITNEITNSTNEITSAIDDNFNGLSCNAYGSNYFQQGGISRDDGTETTGNDRIRSKFISVVGGKSYSFSFTGSIPRYRIFQYDSSKSFLSYSAFQSGDINYTLNEKTKYIRLVFAKEDGSSYKPSDFGTINLCAEVNKLDEQLNQQQQTNDKLDETNDKLNDLNDNLTNSDAPDGMDSLNSASGWLPPGPVDSLLTLPLSMLNNISTSLGSSCSPINLPLPFVNSNLNLPCLNSIYSQIPGLGVLLNTIGTICAGFMLYYYFKKLYAYIDNLLSLKNNGEGWGDV